jgi:hypothetical protein
MTGSYFAPDWTAKVTVPVKRVGERWEFFYGGDVPVRDGTVGQLTLSAIQIADESFRQRISQALKVKILDEATELLVALSDRDASGRAGAWPHPHPSNVPPGTTRFERVSLGPVKQRPGVQTLADSESNRGGLWLKLKGLERCELQASTVQMPQGFETPVARSLNHAFTLLSQAYEKHRISNTGNVYTRVFYQDHNKCWYPLDDLRTGVQAEGERTLLRELWAQVEQTLGWRPASPPAGARRKRT